MLFPLLGSSIFSGIYYGSNEQIKKLLGVLKMMKHLFKIFKVLSDHKYDRSTLPLRWVFFSGSLAGVTTSLVAVPIEHVKIRLQVIILDK